MSSFSDFCYVCLCLQAPEFPDFNDKVLEAINSLGGCVFPKLNWSAPRVSSNQDCANMNERICCQTLIILN